MFNGKSCWGVQGGVSPLANFGVSVLTIFSTMLIHISIKYLYMSILFCTFVGTKEIIILITQPSTPSVKSDTMNKEERLELAKKLINEEINRTLGMWKGDDLLTYGWGWRNEETVSSNHHTCFYNYDEVKAIANGLRLNVGLSVGPNCDGNMTPYVHIW